MNRPIVWTRPLVAIAVVLCATSSRGQVEGVLGAANGPPIKVHDQIYAALGFGNTFLVRTEEGNVIIDTSLPDMAQRHHKALTEISPAPIRYIIFTHAHDDHTAGAGLWKQPDTQVVAQRLFVEMRAYQDRLAEFFARRNAAQFGFSEGRLRKAAQNRPPRVEPTTLFDEEFEFELGGTQFQLFHTPGETYEHLTVWMPQFKAAFVGDNFYASFPNMYTLRGTRPRWALDYIDSLNKVLALKPEIVLPSHGEPLVGADKAAAALTRYRDAIQYVHDETVKGMNAGKDVYTLMARSSCRPNWTWATPTARSPGAFAASTKATWAGSTVIRPTCTPPRPRSGHRAGSPGRRRRTGRQSRCRIDRSGRAGPGIAIGRHGACRRARQRGRCKSPRRCAQGTAGQEPQLE